MSKTTRPAVAPREQEWLNGSERADLRAHEATLDHGMQFDVARGKALADIRDRRLYRESHDTFEAFCAQPRWRLSRAQAYRLIDLAGIATIVSPTGDTPAPANERVARELAPLREVPEAMVEAWSETVERHGPEPTAAQTREVVREPQLAAPPDPGDDLRYICVEDAAAVFRVPAATIALPITDGEVEAMDAALKHVEAWMKVMTPRWREHRAALRAQKRREAASERTLRAVA